MRQSKKLFWIRISPPGAELEAIRITDTMIMECATGYEWKLKTLADCSANVFMFSDRSYWDLIHFDDSLKGIQVRRNFPSPDNDPSYDELIFSIVDTIRYETTE